MLTIGQDLIDAMVSHARADHPDEACGVIAGPDGSDTPTRFIPMLNAARQQRINTDLGLAAFEELQAAGTTTEPYLPYVIGTLYENRIPNLTRTKTQLAAAETPDAAKIAEVTAQIDDAKAKAIAAYQATITQAGSDTDIQARIDALQAPASTSTTLTPQ